VPELPQVEVRPAACGADDDDAAVRIEMRLVVARLGVETLSRRFKLRLAHRRDAR
jgi:hypothetical protein